MELVDYTRVPSSSTAAQPGSHLAQSRSQSPPSGSFHSGSQHDPRFWLPTQPMEGPSPTSIPTVPTSDEHSTEQQLLQATGGEGRGLKITRRHSVEDRQKHITNDATLEVGRIASFSGTERDGRGRREAFHREKQWESEMERELEIEIAHERESEREKERARMRERRREKEQRERRREKEHRAREERAREREERERERERARERRLESEVAEKSSPEVQEPTESFL